MPYIYADPIAVNEGSPSAAVRVYLDAPSVNEIRVSYQLDAGTASHGSATPDYQYQNGTLVFAPGQTEKTIDIVMLDGAVVEPTEVFWLDLYSPVSATIIQRYTPIIIHDNDSNLGGTPAITAGDVTVDESSGKATFFVWLDRPSPGGVSVQYTTVPGSATAGQDFVAKSGTLSFANGSRVASVTVDLVDDTLAERDEFFQLQLSGAVGATLAESTATATIGRNDTAPVSTPYIFAKPAAVSEGDTFIEFVVQLSAPSTNEVRVSYQADAGTASHGSATPDYQYQSGVLVFAPGETTQTVRFPQLDNTTAESTEVFWLDLYSPVNGIVPQRYTPAVIADNDQPTGTPVVSVGDLVIDEAAHTATFVITMDRPSTGTVTVGYQAVSGTAVAGQDFTLPAGALSFAPGETLETVTVRLTDDALAEPDEQFKLVLTAPQGATLGRSEAMATIGRSDGAPVSTPYLSATPVAVGEADTFIEFVVQLSAPSSNEVRVSYQADAGTASHGSATPDYQYQSGVLVFAPGVTTQTVRFPQLDGTNAENAEVFWLDLYSPVNAIISQRYTSAVIVDNDGSTGTPGIRVTDVVADERAQTVSFFVTLDKAATSLVTVNYATQGGSAREGDDYLAASGTLRFVPGQTVQKVTVNLVGDNLPELDESFHLVLSNAVGGSLIDPYGKALVGRSDLAPVGAPIISAAPIVVSEADGLASIVVQLSAPSNNEVRVNYQFDAGTASHGTATPDYLYQSGTLVFAAGQTTKTIDIALLDNTVAESTEVFNLDLYSVVNATVAQRYTPITIVDDDSGYRVLSYGIGNDVYEVTAATDVIIESVNGGIDTIRTSLNNYLLPEFVENLTLLGTSNLNGFGNALNNVLTGNAGSNVLDGGLGNDTVDYVAAGSGVTVNLVAGTATGGGGTDTLVSIEGAFGSNFGDLITGTATANVLGGRGGNDTIDGGAGLDVAVYEGARAGFTVQRTSGNTAVVTHNAASEGQDGLANVERLAFSDVYVALDIDPLGPIDPLDPNKGDGGIGGKAYRLYQAAFARTPDEGGVGYWIAQLDDGARLFDVATGFLGSAEFQAAYGVNPSNETYVRALYQNVLGREPDQAGYDYWNSVLNPGYTTRQQMLVDFAESSENKALVIGVIGNGFDYEVWHN